MRTYHSFPTARSLPHLLSFAGILLLPLFALFTFSYVTKTSISELGVDIGASVARIVVAFAISVVLAWLFAVLFYRGRRAAFALPVFDVLQSIPSFAALPMAILLFGPSNTTVIIFLVLAIIWPIFFSITSSLKLVRHDWTEAVEMSRIKGVRYLTHYLIPVTIPGLVTGSIIGLGEGWEALIATEIIVHSNAGLGEFFNSVSDKPFVTLFGVLTFLILIFVQNKLIWLPLLEWSHQLVEE